MHGTRAMLSRITFEGAHIRAELSDRQTALETQEFLLAVVAVVEAHQCFRVLISVKDSRALFKVDEYGISDYLRMLAANPSYRVALLGNSDETRASHEYIVLLARQYGAQVQSFRREPEAVEWLTRG